MNDPQVGAATASQPSVRGMVGEIADNLARLDGNISSLKRIMQNAGLMSAEVESINKHDVDTPRDSSLGSAVRYANNDLRVLCNQLEEINAQLEREVS